MPNPEICINCGADLSLQKGYEVKGEVFYPQQIHVCDFQCLVQWDATGEGLKGNQGVNLDNVKLVDIE